jgi:hypothetical protein
LGGRQDSSAVVVQMFVQPQCVVGLRDVATPQQQTFFGGVFKDRSTLYSPVVTICTAGFIIQQFYVLPTQYIYVFCVDLRTNSDYFPIQN